MRMRRYWIWGIGTALTASLCCLSSVVRATLSRKYRGAARSAATPAPRAKRRDARRATAPARGRSPSKRIATESR